MSDRVPEGWKKKELSFLTNLVSEKTEFNNQFEALTSSRSGLFRQSEYFNKRVTSADNTGYRIIAPGQFTFRAMSDDGTFKFNRSTYSFTGIVSPAYEVFEAKNCSPDFLDYVLNSDEFHQQIYANAQGGTRLALKYSSLSKLEVQFPSVPEQKKIASILTSVDEVIENTQKQIDKLQDLKKATMNELLTEGIGHTEFKDSEIGRIPKSWELVKLGDTGKWKGGGTPSKSNSEFWEGSIPWVSPKDMKYEYISKTEDYVSDFAVVNSSTSLIEAGAILIVVRSGILKHTLPVAISKCNLTINQDMKALSVSNNFSNLFIYHYLVARNHLVLRSTLKAGNTVESIDTQVFSEYLIPSPPLQEQIEIANAIESIASQIRKKKRKLTQTQYLKKSLMQDLLTGKVRVQVN